MTPSSSRACHMPITSCLLNESWSVDTRFISQSISSLPEAHLRTTDRPPPVFRSLSTVFWSLSNSVRSTQPALAIGILGFCANATITIHYKNQSVYVWISAPEYNYKNLTHREDCIKQLKESVWQRYNYLVPNYIQSDSPSVLTPVLSLMQSITVN